MNILVLTPWFPDHPNDQQGNFVLDSIEALRDAGHRVHVLVTRPYVPRFFSQRGRRGCNAITPAMGNRGFSLDCIQHLSIPRNRFRFISNWLYQKACSPAIKRLVAAHSIDVIHAHTEAAGYLACKAADGAKIPVVTTLHGINLGTRYLDGFGQRAFMRKALSSPDRLVLVGPPLLEFAARYADHTSHTSVVFNGFREAGALPFRRRNVLGPGHEVAIVSVSNLVDGKGVDINLAALGRSEIAELPQWHYHIVGDGPKRRELGEQAKALGILDRVTFHGQCNHDRVFALLSDCDVFCLPSAPEAFGVAYLEAMACGLLTIGVSGQGPSSFIEDGRTGLLVGERDVESLAGKLRAVIQNPAQYASMAAAGRDHVWQTLTWRNHAQAMTTVFADALQRRAAAN